MSREAYIIRSEHNLRHKQCNKNSAEGYVATAKSSFPHDYSAYLYYFLILVHVQVFFSQNGFRFLRNKTKQSGQMYLTLFNKA